VTTSNKRTSAKLQPLKVEETFDFISGDAIIWGKVPVKGQDDNGDWVVKGYRDQWIARILLRPDGTEHIHFYCHTQEEARKVFIQAFLTHRKDMLKRIYACASMSWGLQHPDWMKPVVVFLDPPGAEKTTKPSCWVKPYDYTDKDGEPSNFRGPYGLEFEELADDNDPAIWLQGRRVKVGDVADLQVDTTLADEELSFVEKVASISERQAWASAVRAGELPGFSDIYTG
jgi:hypothetical protein